MDIFLFFSHKNWHVHRVQKLTKSGFLRDVSDISPPCVITYEYNLKPYKMFLDTGGVFPPEPKMGFFVKDVRYELDGIDRTNEFRQWSGIRHTDIPNVRIIKKLRLTFQNFGFRLSLEDYLIKFTGVLKVTDSLGTSRLLKFS
jgi:hypothetical protein